MSRVDTSVRERARERVAGGALLTSHQHPGLLPLLKFDGAITCGGVRDALNKSLQPQTEQILSHVSLNGSL